MSKKKELSPELKAECDAAKALFVSRKNSLGLTQAKLAEEADISAAAVAMYLNGTNPLNAKFAVVLSRLLDVPVEKFSPRLHEELRSLGAGPSSSAMERKPTGAADKVLEMLQKHAGKKLDDEAQERILAAVTQTITEERTTNVIAADFSGRRLLPGDICIPQYDIRGAMGHGQVPAEYSEAIRNVVISEDVLRDKGIQYSTAASLAMITGWGQSMEGTINDKDPVIVDRGINEFAGDGVYVITWHDLLYIKRLQVHDAEHFEMISDNPKHKDRVIPINDVIIHAKVLLVWNARKL
ncbi:MULTISPECIES: LexA family transcriptional regulator [unclassified Pseudomonas]|uniref:LexA family transcriptional regulator n=1 Tax=unclassified Pseudomonas TaxID=196821 RepID=UPI000CD07FA7|nr:MULTISPECIES: LexA family transcriptional regulator [unclassified Pseudomonas]POA52106.1 propanediol utilization protein [Pseudomonas sp. FW507-12TSA]